MDSKVRTCWYYPYNLIKYEFICSQESTIEEMKKKVEIDKDAYYAETPGGPSTSFGYPSQQQTHDDEKDVTPMRAFVNDGNSIKRIIKVLQFHYQNQYNDQDEECVNALNEFLNSEDALHLVNDYHHILDKHLNGDKKTAMFVHQQFEKIYKQMINEENDLKCGLSSCKIYQRNNRSREMEIITKRNPNLSFYVDLLDTMYCYFIHSVDCGYRTISNDPENDLKCEVVNNENSFIDQEFKMLLTTLTQKQLTLQNIRGQDRLRYNKFVTTVISKNDQDEKGSEEYFDDIIDEAGLLSLHYLPTLPV